MSKPLLLEQMKWPEVEKALKIVKTIIIPLGPLEEHGPQLPLSTDYLRPIEIAKRVAKELPVFVHPVIPLGVTNSARAFPGTISIRPETLKGIISDFIESLSGQGFKNVIFLSGHSGSLHNPVILDAIEKFKTKIPKVHCYYFTTSQLSENQEMEIIESENDSHAGEQETSEMLYLREDSVDMEKAVVEYPDTKKFKQNTYDYDFSKARDYWKTGVNGDATKANKKKGEKLIKIQVKSLVNFIKNL